MKQSTDNSGIHSLVVSKNLLDNSAIDLMSGGNQSSARACLLAKNINIDFFE